jgi:hypothetical protein
MSTDKRQPFQNEIGPKHKTHLIHHFHIHFIDDSISEKYFCLTDCDKSTGKRPQPRPRGGKSYNMVRKKYNYIV